MTTTWTNQDKSGVLTYFVAEDGTIYLMGSTETASLVTQDITTWTNQTKS